MNFNYNKKQLNEQIDNGTIILTYDYEIFNNIFENMIDKLEYNKRIEKFIIKGDFKYKDIFNKIRDISLEEYKKLIIFYPKISKFTESDLQHIKNCFTELKDFNLNEIESLLKQENNTIYKEIFSKYFIDKLTLNDFRLLFLSLIFVNFKDNIDNEEFNKYCEDTIFSEKGNFVDYCAYFNFKSFFNKKFNNPNSNMNNKIYVDNCFFEKSVDLFKDKIDLFDNFYKYLESNIIKNFAFDKEEGVPFIIGDIDFRDMAIEILNEFNKIIDFIKSNKEYEFLLNKDSIKNLIIILDSNLKPESKLFNLEIQDFIFTHQNIG